MGKIIQEFHICDEFNGHEPSTDCWCEPVNIKTKTIEGTVFKVVEHVDTTSSKIHRKNIIFQRSSTLDYVTKLLNSISERS